MNTKICVSIAGKDLQQTMARAAALADRGDIIEIRLDLMKQPAVAPFLSHIDLPLLFTCRAAWEGGRYTGSESARLDLLAEAVRGGAAYVDLELLAPTQSWTKMHDSRAAASGSPTKLICSWHDFSRTPAREELQGRLESMRHSGADIGKIVTMAHDFRDVLRVLSLQELASQMSFPLIAFCMGEAGRISRLATNALGGYMTYCTDEDGEQTAPGQISVDTMRRIQRLMQE
jgi:3-dehydroquinate dehydratase I